MPNVINLTSKKDNLEQEMEQVLLLNRENKITNFQMSYVIHNKEEKDPAYANRFYQYWFGDSTFLCLGMVSRMMDVINHWIKGESE